MYRGSRLLHAARTRGLYAAGLLAALLISPPALADDLILLQVGGAAAGSKPPPNILFLFDTSGSMNNLPCEEFDTARRCSWQHNNTSRSAPNSATVCENTALKGATGPDVTGDGRADPYRSLYASDGTTYRNVLYPTFDLRKTGSNDDYFPAWSVYDHTLHSAYTVVATGSGSTTRAMLDDVIADTCNALTTDCFRRSRCIYSFRTQGYFWEPSSSCASGDPLAMCGACTPPPARSLGAACTRDNQCDSGVCERSRCSTCDSDNDCPGNRNDCVNTGCQHHYCESETCSVPVCSSGSGSFTNSYPYVLGDFMNFYPPKGIALIKAFTDTINNMSGDARIGVSDFDDTRGQVHYEIKPPCSQSRGAECFDGNPATACFNTSDANLINYLYGIEFNDSTPLAIKLDNAGKSFTAATGANVPICDYGDTGCGTAKNFIIAITDGMPSNDANRATEVPFVNGKVTGFKDGYINNQPNGQFVDDVARALARIDHSTSVAGDQVVNTYAVSYGITDPADPTRCVGLLEDVGTSGGGRCLPANNVQELRLALTEIVSEIIQRALGFTSPSVPATRQSGTVSLSNAVFRPSGDFALWEGHVFGFKLCDEAQSRERGPACTCVANAIDEVCIQDANGNDIAYDDKGNLLSKPYWDAALCLAGDAAGSLGPVDADKGNLDVSACYRSAANRVIRTAVASAGTPTGSFSSADQIEFAAANVATGSPLLGALQVSGNDVATGQRLVNFFRGYDSFDVDADNNTTEDRNLNTIGNGTDPLPGWWKLGDTFHSIPVTIERPDPTLVGAWGMLDSYKGFREAQKERDRLLVVGANDGMVHAFLAAVWDASANNGNGAYVETSADAPALGKEAWAFVTPEMLPQLKSLCSPSGGGCGVTNHRFMVDGSVMVRDIWIGAPGDDPESSGNDDLWKTVVVVGHRDGGRTYVALDVTDPDNPAFLWQFPQPGTLEETQMGKSWLDVAPALASIGPLAWDHDGNPATQFVPRWVVLLSGGFDPLDLKGRALFMLDAYTGEILWKVEHTTTGATAAMDYSFPATPVYYATNTGGGVPYIGGVVAADHGGQVWHIKTPPAALRNGRFEFVPEVVFRTNENLIPANLDGTLAPGEYQRKPFFFAPTITSKSGRLRIIIGTGDRDMLIPHPFVHATINDYICDDTQRLYSFYLDLVCGTERAPRPCNESDLEPIDIARQKWATAENRGWVYTLPAGEKVATPFNIFPPFALYAVFAPTVACGTAANTCNSDSKGDAKMYALDFITGKPIDWNLDGDLAASEASVSLGSGVPTAPRVSVAVGADGSTPTLIAGGSDSGLVSRKIGTESGNPTLEIMRFVVTRELHDALH